MRRLVLVTLLFTLLLGTSSASADWRWADPDIKQPNAHIFSCKTTACKHKAKRIAKIKLKLKKLQYHYKKEREWHRWITRYIPDCTWLGESGPGPPYARFRYTLPNSLGSDAFGKFQMMPGTYHSRAKYHDWSPLDQEIASRKEFRINGTGPWEGCH